MRYRNRKSKRTYNRRHRNQGVGLGGDFRKVAATLGGALVTNLVTGFLPAQFTGGWTGTLATGVVALMLGKLGGSLLHDKQLGNWITVGGLLLVGLQIMQQLVPSIAMPITLAPGMNGMGLITSSNFYTPQVNQHGSMASFVLPSTIPPAIPLPAPAAAGMGQYRSMRRVGRLR